MKRRSLTALLIAVALAYSAPTSGQCVGGRCPEQQFPGISKILPFQQFRDPDGGGKFDPVDCEFSAACRINGASGMLVAKGENWGVVYTCAHGPLPAIATIVFPATGERFDAKLLAADKSTDNALYRINGRPKAALVRLSERMPTPGEEIGYGGFGLDGKWQAFRGKFLGVVTSRQTNERPLGDGVRWAGSARPGDSGGPAWIPGKGVFSLVTASGHGETVGPSVMQLCQLIDENRTLFPWNADTLREKSRNESEVAREALRTEQERVRAAAQQQPAAIVQSGPSVDQDARNAIDRLSALVNDHDKDIATLEESVATGRELVEKLGLLNADVDTVAKAAELLTGKVAAAETKAAEAEAKAEEAAEETAGIGEKLKDAVSKADGAATVAEGLKEGIAGKAKEAVMGVLMKFGPWGLGGLGLALFAVYKIIRKDIRDFLENGDPLIIQKIARRVPGELDDRAADFIADRIQRRWGPPAQPAATMQQPPAKMS